MLEEAANAVMMLRDDQCATCEDIARAVLITVRELDDGPLDAACDVGPDTNNGGFSHDDARTVFTAMIDAILDGK